MLVANDHLLGYPPIKPWVAIILVMFQDDSCLQGHMDSHGFTWIHMDLHGGWMEEDFRQAHRVGLQMGGAAWVLQLDGPRTWLNFTAAEKSSRGCGS